MTTPLLVFGALTAVIVWGALFPLRRLLLRWEMIDRPNDRSSHETPTPRGGGLAIVSAVLMGVLLWSWILAQARLAAAGTFVIVGGVVAIFGWIDDRRPLSARVRLLAQVCAGITAMFAFGYIESVWVPFVGSVWIGWPGIALTLLWIVGLTNAYNFMDGIDGLAAGQAVITGTCWLLVSRGHNDSLSGTLGLLVACASLGFLFHNWPPARLFLGDVASGFLGFTFAVLTLPGIAGNAYSDRLIVGAGLFVGLFIGDATLTFIRRLRNGEQVFDAHRSHLYQQLTPSKAYHLPVTLLYLALALLSASCGFVFLRGTDSAAAISMAIVAASLYALVLGANRTTARRVTDCEGPPATRPES